MFLSRRVLGSHAHGFTYCYARALSEEKKCKTVSAIDFVSRPPFTVDKVIRVSHAGEFGANRLYDGQLSVLGCSDVSESVRHMQENEREHLKLFNNFVTERRVRPTALLPLWNIAGYVLGAGTAMIGKEAAMACTVAVEEAVVEHYNSQLRELIALGEGDKELLEVITQCRDEELEHRDTGLDLNARQAPAYDTMSEVIKTGCRAAIWLSERL